MDLETEDSFSQEELRLYLRYCKFFKPKFTIEAAKCLKDEYVKLREGDISSAKSSYRITVRQLESLIRLSEALAKIHLSEKISEEEISPLIFAMYETNGNEIKHTIIDVLPDYLQTINSFNN